VKYIIRLNMKAYNPITGKVDPKRVWEVEQAATKDSAKCVWHCAEVTIRRGSVDTPIRDIIKQRFEDKPESGKVKLVEFEYWGVVFRGQDDAIVIHERGADR
jgi:hypothetical protein